MAASCVAAAPRPSLPCRATPGADRDRHARGHCALVRRERARPGGTQADRALLPGERRALQDAARNLAAVRADLPRARDGGDHARVPRRACAGGGTGNPVARTYWRWRATPEPFEVYRPASSAVGMYQITDGTFAEASAIASTTTSSSRMGPVARPAVVLVQRPLSASCLATRSSSPPHTSTPVAGHARAPADPPQPSHRGRTSPRVIHLCGAGAGDATRGAASG